LPKFAKVRLFYIHRDAILSWYDAACILKSLCVLSLPSNKQ
jgi:hypothetical protein